MLQTSNEAIENLEKAQSSPEDQDQSSSSYEDLIKIVKILGGKFENLESNLGEKFENLESLYLSLRTRIDLAPGDIETNISAKDITILNPGIIETFSDNPPFSTKKVTSDNIENLVTAVAPEVKTLNESINNNPMTTSTSEVIISELEVLAVTSQFQFNHRRNKLGRETCSKKIVQKIIAQKSKILTLH